MNTLLKIIGGTVLFLLITIIFGVGGCISVMGSFNKNGIFIGLLWLMAVACGAMWLVIRLIKGPKKSANDDSEP